METNDMIGALALMTFVLALVVGVWQYFRVQKAKRTHEHSSLTNVSATAKAGGVDSSKAMP